MSFSTFLGARRPRKLFGEETGLSLRQKILFFSLAITTTIVLASTYVSYVINKAQLDEILSRELTAIVTTLAPHIDTDLHENIFNDPEFGLEGEEEFHTLRKQLKMAAINNALTIHTSGSPIYTLRKSHDFDISGKLEFVVMTHENEQGEFFVGNTIQAEAFHYRVFAGSTASSDLYWDEHGGWISAAAPLYQDGEVVAIIQADRFVEFYQDQILKIVYKLLLMGLFLAASYGIVAFYYSKQLTNPIAALIEGTTRIGKGIYTTRIKHFERDEVGTLVKTFNLVSEKLQKAKITDENQRAELEKLTLELQEHNNLLESKVEARTSEIQKSHSKLEQALEELAVSQSHLIQSEKMASVGVLAAGVAHEINNPIGFIQSNLGCMNDYCEDLFQLIQRAEKVSKAHIEAKNNGENDPVELAVAEFNDYKEEIDLDELMTDLPELLQESIEGAIRVRDIVANLKGFSHIDNSNKVATDLNGEIKKTIKVAWNQIKYHCEVKTDFGDLPPLVCHAGQLNQVFLNLIINASHAIEEQGTITISTSFKNDHLRLAFQDDGEGIEAKHLTQLFDPFFTTKPVGVGTGLGLHICKDIIESHGGHIDVNSEVGVGTCFTIELPVNAN